MTGSFEVSGGRLVIKNGSRTVATTGGTLLQFLTNEQSISGSVSYPDANKTQLYQWRYRLTRGAGDNFSTNREAGNAVGALPQEWFNQVNLAAIPAGADIFIGRLSLARTASPSHTWLGQPLSPVVPIGVAIPVNGGASILLEMGPGISRALTIDVESGFLVAKLQQSVGPAAGNFGTNGNFPFAVPPNSTSDNYREGAENVSAAGIAGLPVWWNLANFISQTQNFVGLLQVPTAQAWTYRARYGGSEAVPYSDPTNYGSTYSLSLQGRFGRRS